MIWFTADTHFGHAKSTPYCSRPFASVEEMDAALIANWNRVVALRDEVWHLGDFCFRTDPKRYRDQLNGRIHLRWGNHDRDRKALTPLFESVGDVHYLRYEGRKFFLSHYAHRTWPSSHHGTFHLFGHSHGDLPGYGRSMDVGVDAQQYTPISINEVMERLAREAPTPHHLERVLDD